MERLPTVLPVKIKYYWCIDSILSVRLTEYVPVPFSFGLRKYCVLLNIRKIDPPKILRGAKNKEYRSIKTFSIAAVILSYTQ